MTANDEGEAPWPSMSRPAAPWTGAPVLGSVFDRGAADERAAVVAWLRGKAGNNPSPVSLAVAIERGEHRE